MSAVRRECELDCGGHSCRFARVKMGMRHNGPCTCAQKLIDNNNALQRALATVQGERERYKEALEEIRKAYTEYCNEYAYSIAQAALAQPAAPSEVKE